MNKKILPPKKPTSAPVRKVPDFTINHSLLKKGEFLKGALYTSVIFIIILTIISTFLIYYLIKENKNNLKLFYTYQSYKDEAVIPYEKRKEIFIKKAVYIFKNSKECSFDDETKIRLSGYIFDKWQETHISGYLCLALMFCESKFNVDARGTSGERGAYQFMLSKWIDLTGGGWSGKEKDIYYTTDLWFKIIQDNMNYFDNLNLALLAYNCGGNAVDLMKRDVKKIHKWYKIDLNRKEYDLDILKKYNEYINLTVE